MVIGEFLAMVRAHPGLELVYADPTVCIIRCQGPEGERRIRLGLWAVRRMRWEEIIAALGLPARDPA